MRAGFLVTALLTGGLAGCTAHLSAGPHVRPDGNGGSTVAASVAVGVPLRDYRLLAVGGNLMVTDDDVTRVGGGGNIDYVDLGMVIPMRATLRVGGVTRVDNADPPVDYPTRLAFGGAIAFYPFHNDFRSIPDHSDDPAPTHPQRDDDMLSGLDDMFKSSHDHDDDTMAFMYGVGLEVAVDVLPTTIPNDPRELFVSLSVVGELSLTRRPPAKE